MKIFEYSNNRVRSNSSDNYIMSRLLEAYPELVTEEILKNNMKNDYWYMNPNSKFMFGYPHTCSKTFTYSPKVRFNDYFDYASSFENAIRRLNKYAKEKYGYDKLYDFVLADGTPVKEYQNFIQIGYNIIPKGNYSNYYKNLSLRDKVTINNVVIVINNMFNVEESD